METHLTVSDDSYIHIYLYVLLCLSFISSGDNGHNTVFLILPSFDLSIGGLRFRGLTRQVTEWNWGTLLWHPGLNIQRLTASFGWTQNTAAKLTGWKHSSPDVNGVLCKCCYLPQRSLQLWWMMHTATFIIHTLKTMTPPAYSQITHQHHLEICGRKKKKSVALCPQMRLPLGWYRHNEKIWHSFSFAISSLTWCGVLFIHYWILLNINKLPLLLCLTSPT